MGKYSEMIGASGSDDTQRPSYAQMVLDSSAPEVDLEKERQLYSPTAGQSFASLSAAGAGKAVSDIGRGTYELGAEALNRASSRLVSDEYIKSLRQKESERTAEDKPLMETGAGKTGYIAGNLATTMIPLGAISEGLLIPKTLKAAGAIGALQGATSPVGTEDSRTFNTVLGTGAGLAGQGAANVLGKIASPVAREISDGVKKAADTLQAHGITLSAAQKTGDTFLRKVASSFTDNPLTASAQHEFSDAQQKQFNKAVLSHIGEDSDRVTPEVMQSAKQRIGKVFDDVAERNPVSYDTSLHNDLQQIRTDASKELMPEQMHVIDKQIANIVEKAESGVTKDNPEMNINGKAYQNIKQSLDRLQAGNDPSIKHWAGELQDAMEEGLGMSTAKNGNPQDLQALKQARFQWGNMRKLEGAIDKNLGEDISPAKLMSALNVKRNRPSLIYGYGDQSLNDLARAGNALLPDKHPNSGTAARVAMSDYLNPVKVGSWIGGKAAQKVINAPAGADYLTSGVKNVPLRSILELPQKSPLASNVLRTTPLAYISTSKASEK